MFEERVATIRPEYAIADSQSALIRSVFGWMTLGLGLTGFVSMFVLNTPAMSQIVFSGGLMLILLLLELGLVFWLSARVMKMSASKATSLFLLYSALNGITLSPIAFAYTAESLTSTFMVTAGLFGSMALYGYATKRDLSSWGSFLGMGLWGILIAMIVNIFLQSSGLAFVYSVIGVLVFTGLTAYDVHTLRQLGRQADPDSEDFRRFSIIGALKLYLDFINLFLMLLRFMGDRD